MWPNTSVMEPNVSGETNPAEGVQEPKRRVRWIWAMAVGVLLIAAAATAWSLRGPDSDSLEVQELWTNEDAGVILATEWGSASPTRVTGTSLDQDLVVGDSAGWLWDNTVPDQDMGFEFVDITGSKKVSLNFTFIPDCALTDVWEEVDVSIHTDSGVQHATVTTPELPDLVAEWCALPMQVEVGSGSASANWCRVEREYNFTNPLGKAATVRLSTPGWQMEDLVFDEGQYEATALVTSDTACSLPRNRKTFVVEYEDGSESTVTGPNPTKDM